MSNVSKLKGEYAMKKALIITAFASMSGVEVVADVNTLSFSGKRDVSNSLPTSSISEGWQFVDENIRNVFLC